MSGIHFFNFFDAHLGKLQYRYLLHLMDWLFHFQFYGSTNMGINYVWLTKS